MEGELTHHLGYDKYSSAGKKSGNSRNGKSSKTIKGDFGELPIEVPRDLNGDFNPHIIYSQAPNPIQLSYHLQVLACQLANDEAAIKLLIFIIEKYSEKMDNTRQILGQSFKSVRHHYMVTRCPDE